MQIRWCQAASKCKGWQGKKRQPKSNDKLLWETSISIMCCLPVHLQACACVPLLPPLPGNKNVGTTPQALQGWAVPMAVGTGRRAFTGGYQGDLSPAVKV